MGRIEDIDKEISKILGEVEPHEKKQAPDDKNHPATITAAPGGDLIISVTINIHTDTIPPGLYKKIPLNYICRSKGKNIFYINSDLLNIKKDQPLPTGSQLQW